MEPATPPLRMFLPNFSAWLAFLEVPNAALIVSLNAKFRACVGKYLRTLARLPRQKERRPSLAMVLLVQSRTPPYGLSSTPCFSISPWFCTSSFTRSMGAAAVLDAPAATPESMKFSKKLSWGFFLSAILSVVAVRVYWSKDLANGSYDALAENERERVPM